ncbi:MAG: putative transporter [Paludibacteraceae bacterium]|nr:putative transporter [Paludibacteraceae bacterium]MBR6041346.1 putative transporter [Paludibacteraceae bacterium]
MSWIENLLFTPSVAHSLVLVALVIAIGLYLSRIKIGGISIGVTWILFVGIVFGHFGLVLDATTSHFVKEFGLILFIYSIGIQVGPGFFESFKSGGLTLNGLAAATILLAGATCLLVGLITNEDPFAMIGVLYGAVTNTPGLGAAQQTFSDMTNGVSNPNFASGYAVAYPLGVVGIIGSIVAFRYIFRINLEEENRKLQNPSNAGNEPVTAITFEAQNSGIYDKTVGEIQRIVGRKAIITRIQHTCDNKIELANENTAVAKGDRLFVVLAPEETPYFEAIIGKKIEGMETEEWDKMDKNTLVCERIVVTNQEINGTELGKLALRTKYNVHISRVKRAGVDLMADPRLVLQLGDRLTVVGEAAHVKVVQQKVGDSVKKLDEPNLMAVFLGIALGVLLGSIPFFIPGMSVPVKLGLAGGPLIVSILVSKFGTKFKLVTYTTSSANLLMRQIGITLFLAAVGIGAGEGFVDTVLNGGYRWILYGFVMTVVPIITVGLIGHFIFKVNYFQLAGMISGALTDPPALAYSNSICSTDQASVAYSTVYPLSMFLRVVSAQILVLTSF